MPGLVTHYLCAEAVLATLSERERRRVAAHRGLYNVGAQGPDIFFYGLPVLPRGGRRLGRAMHQGGVARFTRSAAKRLAALRGRDKDALLAYLCGYMTHYCLDYTAHPYVYYHSGFPAEGEAAMKYSVRHRKFETAVDVAMLKLLTGSRPADNRLWRMASVRAKDCHPAAQAIAEAITDAYGVALKARHVRRSMALTALTTRVIQSRKGRRRRLLAAAERAAFGGEVCSSLIHPQTADEAADCLNLTKTTWFLPYDEQTPFTLTFPELFDQACSRARAAAQALFALADGEQTIDAALERIGDYSLKTGAAGDAAVAFTTHK